MICEKCGKSHDGSFGSGRFCSRSCANSKTISLETKKKISLALGGTGNIERLDTCLNCGKPLKNRQRKWCSLKCQGENKKKQFTDQIDRLGYVPNLPSTASGGRVYKIKRYLIEKFGHKCQKCGGTERFGKPMPLWLDHIDGIGSNWKIDNLRLVCPNCDFFSDTYCGRNKGQGRRKLKAY